MNFNTFKTSIATQFQRMQQYPLFRVDIDKDELWTTYLSSFPPGTNLIYRERGEYDCSCCRQFIRAVGDVVAIVDGKIESLWDVGVPHESAFQIVANALSTFVKSKPILSPFLHYEPTAGTDRSFEAIAEPVSGGIKDIHTWTHFFINIDRKFVKTKDAIPTLLSESRSRHDVFLRSLREITSDSIDTVLDLIAQRSLYRGEEHKASLVQFQTLKQQFHSFATPPLADLEAEDLFAWTADASGVVSRIRNTAIGTLLTDLSEGRDLEDAVKSFEVKVAPTNYKRPTALITLGMIAKAKETLTSLGLLSALDRRYATIRDLNVNNILFTDRSRSAHKSANGDVFDDLSSQASALSKAKNFDKVEEVSIDRFISEILPRAESIEILFENRHQGNLVSLIAPSDPTSRPLFKWDNNFSWSYAGELADAIKEKVKQAGGNVTGDLCCRLAWFNHDDLDLHMKEPGRYEIYYESRYHKSPSGGRLDVDMNVSPTTREPVENIFYEDRSQMKEGVYHLFVHQYNKRESADIGFQCEIDFLGQVYRFTYNKAAQGQVTVAKFNYSHKEGLQIIESLPSSESTRVVWNLPTQTFHKVNTLLLSPNYWNEEKGSHPTGNKHFFFMLEGAKNDDTARGFYNEFLSEDLNKHRKVFEVLASKTKPEPSDDQLSGLGFSSTRRDSIVCRVKGSFTRTIKVTF